ncbi:MAG: hypothetical protein QOK29_2686 [Rhodospirillaceae bacterium]|nr:hypothetical protein [Rhodospirillaceae bacterium]
MRITQLVTRRFTTAYIGAEHRAEAELIPGDGIMDKDRIAGAARNIKGSIKEVVGKVVGDAKLQSDGKADQVAGKIQNAIGGIKDTLKR